MAVRAWLAAFPGSNDANRVAHLYRWFSGVVIDSVSALGAHVKGIAANGDTLDSGSDRMLGSNAVNPTGRLTDWDGFSNVVLNSFNGPLLEEVTGHAWDGTDRYITTELSASAMAVYHYRELDNVILDSFCPAPVGPQEGRVPYIGWREDTDDLLLSRNNGKHYQYSGFSPVVLDSYQNAPAYNTEQVGMDWDEIGGNVVWNQGIGAVKKVSLNSGFSAVVIDSFEADLSDNGSLRGGYFLASGQVQFVDMFYNAIADPDNKGISIALDQANAIVRQQCDWADPETGASWTTAGTAEWFSAAPASGWAAAASGTDWAGGATGPDWFDEKDCG